MAEAERGQEWQGFPGTRDHKTWPGAWRYGVDFAAESGAMRVVAVNVAGGEEKYGISWVGPVSLTDEACAAALEHWADRTLAGGSGYVHLFPADGDDTDWLLQWDAAEEED